MAEGDAGLLTCLGEVEASSWMASSQAWHWLGDVYFEFMLKISFLFFSPFVFTFTQTSRLSCVLPNFASELSLLLC
jgi:hypothetical protein